jgi:hypothetical protein
MIFYQHMKPALEKGVVLYDGSDFGGKLNIILYRQP